jgi:hypothetical protein
MIARALPPDLVGAVGDQIQMATPARCIIEDSASTFRDRVRSPFPRVPARADAKRVALAEGLEAWKEARS